MWILVDCSAFCVLYSVFCVGVSLLIARESLLAALVVRIPESDGVGEVIGEGAIGWVCGEGILFRPGWGRADFSYLNWMRPEGHVPGR
jgi:hypothetical protein